MGTKFCKSPKFSRSQSVALRSVSIAALLAASEFAVTPAIAQTILLPGVTVYSTTPQLPSDGAGDGETVPHSSAAATQVEDPESRARPPSVGDGGDFLRHVNGVDAGRMGGHGLDPES